MRWNSAPGRASTRWPLLERPEERFANAAVARLPAWRPATRRPRASHPSPRCSPSGCGGRSWAADARRLRGSTAAPSRTSAPGPFAILALGIIDAFRDAELLADAVDAGLTGRRVLEDALADHERRRNELAAQGYENTVRLAGLQPPPPEMQQLLAALRRDREQTDRFFGTLIGSVPAADFFAPENLARLMGAPAPVG